MHLVHPDLQSFGSDRSTGVGPLGPTLFGLDVQALDDICYRLLALLHLPSALWESWLHLYYMLMT